MSSRASRKEKAWPAQETCVEKKKGNRLGPALWAFWVTSQSRPIVVGEAWALAAAVV